MRNNKRYYRDFNGGGGTIIRDKFNDHDNIFEFGLDGSEELCDLLNDLNCEIELLKQKVEDLTFALRTEEAYSRTMDKGHYDTVDEFLMKLEKW